MTDTSEQSSFMPQAVAIIMLLWALYPGNPYGYYVLLRIVICAVCAFSAFRATKIDNDSWAWILGITALIYNPVIPVHLTREIWSVLNIVTIVILAMTFGVFRKQTMTEQTENHTDEL